MSTKFLLPEPFEQIEAHLRHYNDYSANLLTTKPLPDEGMLKISLINEISKDSLVLNENTKRGIWL